MSKKLEDYSEENRKKTYYQLGFTDSTNALGNTTLLDICLQDIYAKFQNEVEKDKEKQERLKEPYRKEKSELETTVKTNTVVLDIEKEEEEICKQKIGDLKNKIADIRANPEKYFPDVGKGSSAKFWIGLFLIISIAIYLFTFYISASYSAFFKQFEIGEGVIDSIFDPNAFEKAWKDGTLEGLFVTFIPFVFLGLGFLIHMFGESKKIINYFKITALFIITFVFDAILAYQIDEKLNNLTRNIDSPEFNINIAFKDVNFWAIIFAGFVVYIIFGLVFDFVMKEYNERDKVKMVMRKIESKIDTEEKKIDIEEKKIDEIKKEIRSLKEKIAKNEGRIEELDRIIRGFITPVKEYKLHALEYLKGWTASVLQNFPNPGTLVKDCKEIYGQHIKEVVSNNSQNKTFI